MDHGEKIPIKGLNKLNWTRHIVTAKTILKQGKVDNLFGRRKPPPKIRSEAEFKNWVFKNRNAVDTLY